MHVLKDTSEHSIRLTARLCYWQPTVSYVRCISVYAVGSGVGAVCLGCLQLIDFYLGLSSASVVSDAPVWLA